MQVLEFGYSTGFSNSSLRLCLKCVKICMPGHELVEERKFDGLCTIYLEHMLRNCKLRIWASCRSRGVYSEVNSHISTIATMFFYWKSLTAKAEGKETSISQLARFNCLGCVRLFTASHMSIANIYNESELFIVCLTGRIYVKRKGNQNGRLPMSDII